MHLRIVGVAVIFLSPTLNGQFQPAPAKPNAPRPCIEMQLLMDCSGILMQNLKFSGLQASQLPLPFDEEELDVGCKAYDDFNTCLYEKGNLRSVCPFDLQIQTTDQTVGYLCAEPQKSSNACKRRISLTFFNALIWIGSLASVLLDKRQKRCTMNEIRNCYIILNISVKFVYCCLSR